MVLVAVRWQFSIERHLMEVIKSCDHLWKSILGTSQVVKTRLPLHETLESRFDPLVGKIPWSRAWQPTPVFLPGDSHGQRSLAGYSPWGCKESDTAEATWQTHGAHAFQAE